MNSRRTEFLNGARAELPILVGVLPFGMIYGVLAVKAGISQAASQAMSAVIFAGSAQFIVTQLFLTQAPVILVVFTIFVINLRHALYSASVSPYLRHLPSSWKWFLAYLLTDEAYAVVIADYQKREEISPYQHWFFLGAGFALWLIWQLSTAVGVFVGAVVPSSWSLDFTLALTFIAIIVPTIKDRSLLAAAITASLVALLTAAWPYKLGLVAAAITAISAGLLVEKRS